MSEFCNDYFAIVSGDSFKYSKAYIEATESVAKSTPKGLAQLKSFISAIEEISHKDGVKDSRITSSRGNITQFSGYDNIKTAMEFIKKNLGGIEIFKDIDVIYKSLVSNASIYSEAYSKNIRLIVLEYESAVYLVVTGLSMVMATNMDVVQNGTSISIQKKGGTSYGETGKCIKDLAKQMGSSHHKDYLEAMIKSKEMNAAGENPKRNKEPEKVTPKDENVNESVLFFEATVADTVELVDIMLTSIGDLGRFAKRTFIGLKNSIFGIIPLIRSVLYLRYKKKADTVLALDQQCKFIQQNIEQLQNMKTMDPEKKAVVIQRQKATIEAYQKKAAKLRAELCDGERESTDAAKKDEPEISKKANDDDFVLESMGLARLDEAGTHQILIQREIVPSYNSSYTPPTPPSLQKELDNINKRYKFYVALNGDEAMSREEFFDDPSNQVVPTDIDNPIAERNYGPGWKAKLRSAFINGATKI